MARIHSTRKPPPPHEALVLTLPPDLLDRLERRVPEAERGRFVQRLLETALTEPEPGATAAPALLGKQRRKPGHDRAAIAEDFNAPLSPEEAERFGF